MVYFYRWFIEDACGGSSPHPQTPCPTICENCASILTRQMQKQIFRKIQLKMCWKSSKTLFSRHRRHGRKKHQKWCQNLRPSSMLEVIFWPIWENLGSEKLTYFGEGFRSSVFWFLVLLVVAPGVTFGICFVRSEGFSRKARRFEDGGFYYRSELFSKALSSREAANVRKRGLRKIMYFWKWKNRFRDDALRFWRPFRGPVSHVFWRKTCFLGGLLFLRFWCVFWQGPAAGAGLV